METDAAREIVSTTVLDGVSLLSLAFFLSLPIPDRIKQPTQTRRMSYKPSKADVSGLQSGRRKGETDGGGEEESRISHENQREESCR